MKVAIASENGKVFQHFGRTPEFSIFEIQGGKVVEKSLLKCGDSGHGALAGLLAESGVDTLICGGIGGGAINALSSLGITVIGGAAGDVLKAAEAFAEGKLETDPNFSCNHHHHEGGCGENHGGDHECHCH